MFKKILAIHLSSFLIYAPVVYAEDEIAPIPTEELIVALQEGEPAPFAGTLFSEPATVALIIDMSYTEERCNLEIAMALELQQAHSDLIIDSTQASLDSCQSLQQDVLEIKNNQINFLTEQVERASRPNNSLWYALGAASGMFLTLGSAWAYGQIAGS
jgi:hypothetical protein